MTTAAMIMPIINPHDGFTGGATGGVGVVVGAGVAVAVGVGVTSTFSAANSTKVEK